MNPDQTSPMVKVRVRIWSFHLCFKMNSIATTKLERGAWGWDQKKKIGAILTYPMWLRIVFVAMFYKQFSHKHLARHASCDKIYVLSVIGFAGWFWLNQDWWCVVFMPISMLGTGRILSRREQLSVFNGLLQLWEEIMPVRNNHGNKPQTF